MGWRKMRKGGKKGEERDRTRDGRTVAPPPPGKGKRI